MDYTENQAIIFIMTAQNPQIQLGEYFHNVVLPLLLHKHTFFLILNREAQIYCLTATLKHPFTVHCICIKNRRPGLVLDRSRVNDEQGR